MQMYVLKNEVLKNNASFTEQVDAAKKQGQFAYRQLVKSLVPRTVCYASAVGR